jgi:hypothetical protein
MPCDAVPVFIDDMPRFAMSPTSVALHEIDIIPVVREVKIPNNVRIKVIPNEVGHILPSIFEISEKTCSLDDVAAGEADVIDSKALVKPYDNISIKLENQIVISERFLNTLDKDVAELTKTAVAKLNSSFNQIKQDKGVREYVVADGAFFNPLPRNVRLTTMHYVPRPTVIPLDGNKPVSTTIKRPINGCGCLPFSMKQIFAHNKSNI